MATNKKSAMKHRLVGIKYEYVVIDIDSECRRELRAEESRVDISAVS